MRAAIRSERNADIAAHSARFFKTGPGEYGEGDCFLGLRVPQVRALIRRFRECTTSALTPLLHSRFHEERLFAVLMLESWCERVDTLRHGQIYDYYMRHRAYVNNWDLVDGSAPVIVGGWLRDRDRSPLYELAGSPVLWDRRIAVLATFAFIKDGDFADTLGLAARLLTDREDLMHKAIGWMLREIGNRDLKTEEAFLLEHHAAMPRTMLRYAIEKFPERRRQAYLRAYLRGHVTFAPQK